jgi:hypothetical protein
VRLDLAYVGESVNNLEGIESVVAAGGVQIQDAYQTGGHAIRPGRRAAGALRSSWTTSGTSGQTCSSATAGRPATVDQPAAHDRAPVSATTGSEAVGHRRSNPELRQSRHGRLGAAILAQDEVAWNENVQRQTEYEVHDKTRSIVLLFAKVDDWPALEVSKNSRAGTGSRPWRFP